MSCKNIPSLGQLFIKCEDIPRRYSAVLCLELSLVTLPVDSGRSCIFSPSCKAIHSEKEGGKKKTKKTEKRRKHPPPWCSSERSPWLWLAKQLVLIHLSPLLIKNKKCHSLLELQDPPSGKPGCQAAVFTEKVQGGFRQCTVLAASRKRFNPRAVHWFLNCFVVSCCKAPGEGSEFLLSLPFKKSFQLFFPAQF